MPKHLVRAEATILGPFYAEDAHESKDLIVTLNILILIHFPTVEKGNSITSEGKSDYMFVDGVVKDLRGNSIPIQLKMVHSSSVQWLGNTTGNPGVSQANRSEEHTSELQSRP